MVGKCRVLGCKSKAEATKMYRFPRDDNLLNKWKTVLQFRAAENPSPCHRVCSLHFTDSDFILTNLGWKVLAQGAVPSLNLPLHEHGASHFSQASRGFVENFKDGFSEELTKIKEKPDVPICAAVSCGQDKSCVIESCQSFSLKPKKPKAISPEFQTFLQGSEEQFSRQCLSSSNDGALFTCNSCDKEFTSRLLAFMHHMQHMNEKLKKQSESVVCNSCNLTFNDRQHYWIHLKNACHSSRQTIHSVGAQTFFFCPLCGLMFSRRSKLNFHKVIVHSKNPHPTCFQCGISYRDKHDFRKHITGVHLAGKQLCCPCSQVFKTSTEFWLHSDRHGCEKECPECCEQFSQIEDLISHLKSHKSIIFFTCRYCRVILSCASSLKVHMKTHDLIREKVTECLLCEHATLISSSTYYHKHQFLVDRTETAAKSISSPQNITIELAPRGIKSEWPLKKRKSLPLIREEVLDVASDSSDALGGELEEPHKKRKTLPLIKEEVLEVAGDFSESHCLSNFLIVKLEEYDDTDWFTNSYETDEFHSNAVSGTLLAPTVVDGSNPVLNQVNIKYVCDDCDNTFMNSEDMRLHQNLHINRGDFICIDCGVGCLSGRELASHYEQHVNIENDENSS